jgi:hypothetical protein
MTPVRYVIEFSGKTAALGALADSAHEAAAQAASLTRALSIAEMQANGADSAAQRFRASLGRVQVGADGAGASLDGYALSADQVRRRASEAAKSGEDLASRMLAAAETLDTVRGAAGLTADQIATLAQQSAKLRGESAILAAQGQREAQTLRDVADRVEARTRAEEEAAAAVKESAKERAAAERAAAREVGGLERELAKQRDADERVRLGNIRGRANQEIRAIDALIAKLQERNDVDEEGLALLQRRREQVAADADRQEASIRARGVTPDAFGARGTRTTTIGSGVLSSYFDRLFAMGGAGGPGGTGGVSLQGIQQAAGKADTALKGLAGAVGVFSPGAERAASAAGDLVGALEFALTPAGATAAGLLGAAAAATVFVGGAVAAVRAAEDLAATLGEIPDGVDLGFSAAGVEQIKEANRALEAAKLAVSAVVVAVAEDLAPVVEDGARLLAGLGVVAAQTAGAALDNIGQIVDATIAGIASAAASLLTALVAPLRVLALAAEAAEAVAGVTGVGGGAAEALRSAVDGIQDAIRGGVSGALSGAIDGYRLLLRDLVAGTEDEVNALVSRATELRARPGGGAGGADRAAEAAAPLTDDALISELLTAYEEGEDALTRLGEIQADLARAQLTDAERVALAYANQRAEINALADAARAAGVEQAEAQRAAGLAAVDAAEAIAKQRAETERAERAAAERASRRQGIIQAGASFAGGGGTALEFAAAVAPPGAKQILQSASAVANGLAGLGEQGAAGVQRAQEARIESITKGIEELPELLIRVLPALGKAIVTELIPALLKLPFEIARELGSVLLEFFERINPFDRESREDRQERRERRRRRRGLASGAAYVAEDGWMMLHRGETVVPASGATTQAASARTVERLAGGDRGPSLDFPFRPIGESALVLAVERGRRPFGRVVG